MRERCRRGDFDCIVGINLLREGIDLPELKLVAILDADKEGFLRSARSLVQVAGRAARNAEGRVILYADHITDSMKALIDTTNARRAKQQAYNKKHHITPKTILKAARETITDVLGLSASSRHSGAEETFAPSMLQEERAPYGSSHLVRKGKLVRVDQPDWEGLSVPELIETLEKEMFAAADNLEFERAAQLRDQLRALEDPLPAKSSEPGRPRKK